MATVHKHVTHLVEKGLVRRTWNQNRSIELVDDDTRDQLAEPKSPDGHRKSGAKDEAKAEVGTHTLEKTTDPVRMYLREMGTVPLLTRGAFGAPFGLGTRVGMFVIPRAALMRFGVTVAMSFTGPRAIRADSTRTLRVSPSATSPVWNASARYSPPASSWKSA